MTKSIFSGAGYLLSDDTASGGVKVEADMLGCTHCQALIKKSDWRAGKSGAFCPHCDGPICNHCTARMQKVGCEPFVKKFTEQLNDYYRREQNAKLLGI